MKSVLHFIIISIIATACNRDNKKTDATGSFEADEIIVSAETTGKIMSFQIEEGEQLDSNTIVGKIDKESIQLQMEQIQASIEALSEKTADAGPQVRVLQGQLAVQKQQLEGFLKDQERIHNLYKADAATGKQLDDINNQISALRRQMEVTRRQIAVQQNTVYTQNRGILSEKKPLAKKVEQLNEQLSDADIINPVSGTVLIKYAQAGEMVAAGKPLYKIANLAELNLRAYLTGDQFSKLKLGDTVKVKVDYGKEDYKEYDGVVTWISGKAEFTPKTIQTKEERANLVYASKIKVKNDGFLKIGMYGEVEFLNKDR